MHILPEDIEEIVPEQCGYSAGRVQGQSSDSMGILSRHCCNSTCKVSGLCWYSAGTVHGQLEDSAKTVPGECEDSVGGQIRDSTVTLRRLC